MHFPTTSVAHHTVMAGIESFGFVGQVSSEYPMFTLIFKNTVFSFCFWFISWLELRPATESNDKMLLYGI